MRSGGTGLLGVVLAGGRSRRFGSTKADVLVEGRSMLRRGLDAMAPHVDEACVVLGADPRHDPVDLTGARARRDSAPGLGPLEGLRVALEWAREEDLTGAVVLGCDLPLVDADVVGALVERWRTRSGRAVDGVVPLAGELPQPLAAVYSVTALGPVLERLSGGDRSLLGALEALRVEYFDPRAANVDVDRFLNVNTPEQWREAKQALEARAGAGS